MKDVFFVKKKEEYLVTIKSNFSTLGSLSEIEPERGWQVSFVKDDTTSRDLLGFRAAVLHDEYNLSDRPADIFSFGNFFLETDFAQKKRLSDEDVQEHFIVSLLDPAYKNVQNFRRENQWFMMETKEHFQKSAFNSKKENGNLASFNGQLVTFRLSINEV